MAKKPKISYDKESNIISIKFNDKKDVDSDVQGNVVIDYDKDGQVVSIDIMQVDIDEFENQDIKSKVKKIIGTA